jgi:hypothetical protein
MDYEVLVCISFKEQIQSHKMDMNAVFFFKNFAIRMPASRRTAHIFMDWPIDVIEFALTVGADCFHFHEAKLHESGGTV